MAETLEALRARFDRLKKEEKAADEAALRISREAAEVEVALLDAEGRGQVYRACWLRAWLAHDHAECDRLRAMESPDYMREDVARYQAALERAAAQLGVRAVPVEAGHA